jgi:predicted RNase H-like HicB family nuclease
MSRSFRPVVERCAETNLYVGFVPGIAGAHTQAESLDELNANLREVLTMLFEDASSLPES